MIWICLSVALGAEPVVFSSATTQVDWTAGLLRTEVSMVQNGVIWQDTRATEKDARRKLQARLQVQAMDIPISGGLVASEVIAQWEQAGEAMTMGLLDGMGHWRVVETRYFTSGRVELVGELDLTEWLRPFASLIANGPTNAPNAEMNSTGVVVDARHLDLTPSYAPRLLDEKGRVVYDLSALSKQVASTTMPVLWVRDAADVEVIERVGPSPALMVAKGVQRKNDLVLSSRDAARLRLLAGGTSLLQSAPIVIVVSP
jgi:hypothetical protein